MSYPFRVIETMTTAGKVYKVSDARDGLTVSDHTSWSAAVRKAQRCYRQMVKEHAGDQSATSPSTCADASFEDASPQERLRRIWRSGQPARTGQYR